MLFHVDLDPEEEEKECLEYIAMIVKSRIDSFCACPSEDLEKPEEVLEAPGQELAAAEGLPMPRSRNHK
jgi:hypothetical protein